MLSPRREGPGEAGPSCSSGPCPSARSAAGGAAAVGANPGPLPHCSPAPPLGSPRHPRAGAQWTHSRAVIASLSSHTRLLSVLSRLVATEGLMVAHPLGWLWERRSRWGPPPSPQGMCPAALGQSTVAVSYFRGASRAPFPQHTYGERSHCINLRGFSSPTINGDHVSRQCPAASRRLPLARPAFFPASARTRGWHLCLPRRAWRGCPPPGALALTACPPGRTPSSAGTGGSRACAAPGHLLPDMPVDLQLGSPTPAAGDTREPGWVCPEGRPRHPGGGDWGELGWICRN